MNKKIIFLVMFACLLVFVAVWAFGQDSSGVRWEYTSIAVPAGEIVERANQLGSEGWELVSSNVGISSNVTLIFKRPVH